MVTNDILPLAPNELPPNRPFTHPQYTAADLNDLEHTRALLREAVQQAPPSSTHAPYEISGERHRIIVLNHTALLTVQPITVVGFCASKRGNLSPALLEEMNSVDTDLVRELAQHPDILTYSSIQIADGNWKNLVLLRSPEGIGHWRNSPRHGYAADRLSPQYYAHVRLHNGLLPQGLASPHIVLTSTKYYDFDCEPTWRAMRDYKPNPRSQLA